MRVSEEGVALLKRFEGLELEAYQDIAGIWTIGYGHTGPDVQPGMKITESEAEALLRRDLKPREDAVDRLTSVTLNQNEFDALVSFIYNVGIEAYKGSTARRRLNGGDRLGAAEALTWWNKATVNGVLRPVTGLTRRRAAERALFLTPVNPPIPSENREVAENSRITPIEDSPRRENLAESRTIQGATVAGGAGVASSTMGQRDARELDEASNDSLPPPTVEGTVPEADSGDLPPSPDPLADAQAASVETPADEPAGAAAGAEPSDPLSEATAEATAQEPGDAVAPEPIEVAPVPEVADNAVDASAPLTDGLAFEDMEIEEAIAVPSDGPTRYETHVVDAQIQLALMIIIILSILFIIFTRVDDWFHYRR